MYKTENIRGGKRDEEDINIFINNTAGVATGSLYSTSRSRCSQIR